MNHLNITTTIDRPQHDVIVRLKKFFDEHAPAGEMRFTLRAPAELPYIHVGVTFERDVIGTVDHLGGKRRAYRFSWRPADAGPFPIFRGAIVVDEDESRPDRSLMTLDGRYEPPLDFAGQVFDAVIGTKIAHASASDLLERLSAAVQDTQPADFRYEAPALLAS